MSLPYRLSLSGNVKVDLSSVVFCRPARSTRITITQGSLQRNNMAICYSCGYVQCYNDKLSQDGVASIKPI